MSSVEPLGPGRIEPRELEQEMRSSFLDYAMSVIVSRALPDVRDGLKPVHRRGSSGIAVGMATNIPPHNLGEVIDALVAMIDEPLIDVDRLMRHVKGPDFPTGAIVVGRSGIRDAYRSGRGRVVMRARAHIEELR